MALKTETIVNGPFQENCYLVWDDEKGTGIIVDPGDEPDRIARTAGFLEVEVEAIYNTHGHIDHAGAVQTLKERLGVPFAMHPGDETILAHLADQARLFGLPPIDSPEIDIRLSHGDAIRVGGHEGRAVHTPGHTPGGMCFLFDGLAIVGDTLFAGSVGRTDLPGGSHRQLMESIREQLLGLDDAVRVLCGHGPATTIGAERSHNPFLSAGFGW